MRIFSYLRHNRFRPGDLTGGKDFNKLMGLAGHYDISIQLENEPVCNIGNVAELATSSIQRPMHPWKRPS